MKNELHEMSKRMNELNLKIKALKEEAGTYEKKQKDTVCHSLCGYARCLHIYGVQLWSIGDLERRSLHSEAGR